MGYWKSKVLPKIKKVFDKNGTKKTAAAAEATKTFDDSKKEINKEFDEKKTELQPKVIEIYEASSVEVKTLVKEPKEAGLKKHATAVLKFLEELVKIEFPGAKPVSEASSKHGPALVSGPIFFVFEKVSTFIVTEEKLPAEQEAAAAAAAAESAETKEETGSKGMEIVVDHEEKKDEAPAETTGPATEPAAAPAAAPTEPADAAANKKDQPAEPPKP